MPFTYIKMIYYQQSCNMKCHVGSIYQHEFINKYRHKKQNKQSTAKFVSKIVIKEVETIFFVIGLSLPQVTEKIGRS